MKLQDAVDAFKQGGPKGIRRRRWAPDTWLKLNDYMQQDDLMYMFGDNRCTRGYSLNVFDITADDWEVIE